MDKTTKWLIRGAASAVILLAIGTPTYLIISKNINEVNTQKREKNEKLTSLKNVMKQVASRLENGVSLQSSTDAFRPLVDKLAVVREFYPEDPAVISATKSESLFNILQTYWYNTIYYDGIALGLNPEISKFNRIAGKTVATPLQEKSFFGVTSVDKVESKVQRAVMYNYIIRLLKEGSI